MRPLRGLVAGVLAAIMMVAAFTSAALVAGYGSEPAQWRARGTDASLRAALELSAPAARAERFTAPATPVAARPAAPLTVPIDSTVKPRLRVAPSITPSRTVVPTTHRAPAPPSPAAETSPASAIPPAPAEASAPTTAPANPVATSQPAEALVAQTARAGAGVVEGAGQTVATVLGPR